jgi:mannosyltransferase
MATSAASSLRRPRAKALTRPAVTTPTLLGLLAAVSVYVRTREIGAGLWVDEGLSFGIAHRPITRIPGVMREDGSPPLYYMLLHLWTRGLGLRSEQALHAFSLLFAVLAIPVAWALARALLSPRAGWVAAVLVALNPFLTQYAQEARMYSLAVLLSVTASACFIGAFVLRRGRRWTVGYAIAHATLLYTHNWGLFLAVGLAAAFAVLVALEPDRGPLVREGLIAAAIVAVVYAPWLPTLAFQVAHTGAPWANVPGLDNLYHAPEDLLGLTGECLLLLVGGAGLLTIAQGPLRRWPAEARAALAMAVAVVATLAVPWLISQASPTWSMRYLAVVVGPLLLLATIGVARAGRLGIAALAIVALVWSGASSPATKSNVRSVAEAIKPSLEPGDTVISTQPEQTSVVHYYLHHVRPLRWATLFGPLSDVGVTDWRDGVDHLEHTTIRGDLEPILAAVRPGQRVALVSPDFSNQSRWKAPWSKLVRARSMAWEDAMRSDPRFRVVTVEPPNPVRRINEVRATVFVRQRVHSRALPPAGAAPLP